MNKWMEEQYEALGISREVYEFGEKIEDSLKERFAAIDATAEYNQLKVIKAMQDNRVSAECFNMSSGYGYNDLGRDTLEKVYASCFKGEDALVRPQITCGTHALALALMSNLRPGDELLSPVGKPYDTLEEVIGIRPSKGSLAEYGVSYRQVDLLPDGSFDFEHIKEAINERTKLVTIQRSKGYATRPTLSVARIGELISYIKGIKPDVICMVDNCYGEFVEEQEPLEVGADMIVGSLIKNPGGGLAPIGGYIVGKKECVENAAYRLTSPGLGKEVGASLGVIQSFYQGFFLAPTVVSGALKGAIFAARHLITGKDASTGNMVIQGGSGSGKTVLATAMVKALQKETGKPKGKVGKIEASALNKKDVASLLKKISGGCLIIEKAGDISKETAVRLALLLKSDTSGLFVIMEDTHRGIEKALGRDEGFASRFSEKINIPIFTSDELVSFAKAYANELGYTIDEMGILALYNSISNIQKYDK